MFRFDFSGCGLSDGEFGNITVDKYVEEIKIALDAFKSNVPDLKQVTIMAHSFSSCAVLKYLQEEDDLIDKVAFFGPAFNQKVLQRYWFAQSKNCVKKSDVTIKNYNDYITEEDFQDFIAIKKRQSKAHYIANEYFLENEKEDYQELFPTCGLNPQNILIVHGDADRAVPVESNNNITKEIRDRKSTRLNSSHIPLSRMPSSA